MPDYSVAVPALVWLPRIVAWLLLTAIASPLVVINAVAAPANSSAGKTLDLKQLMSQAARGDARASFLLGAAYASGNAVARDDKEAVYWFRNAAKKGLAEAQYNLAIMYATGSAGVKHNAATAAKWHQKAAKQGLAEAQYNLGTMYGTGRGVERDDALAAKWLRKAADQGMVEAVYNLAVLYEHGQGVPQDRKQALSRYQQAADAGYTQARQRLRTLETTVGEQNNSRRQKPAINTGADNTTAAALPARQDADGSLNLTLQQAAQPGQETPVKTAENGRIRSAEWFASLDADRYTLQILSVTKEFSSRAFIKKHGLENDAAYFAVRNNDQTWYAVTYGLYDSAKEAEVAGQSLPESINELKPWVRNTGRIQQSMLR